MYKIINFSLEFNVRDFSSKIVFQVNDRLLNTAAQRDFSRSLKRSFESKDRFCNAENELGRSKANGFW